MILSRVLNPQKPVSIERRLKSWNIEYNFKWNQPYLSRRIKFKPPLKLLKFGLGFQNYNRSLKQANIWITTFIYRYIQIYEKMVFQFKIDEHESVL